MRVRDDDEVSPLDIWALNSVFIFYNEAMSPRVSNEWSVPWTKSIDVAFRNHPVEATWQGKGYDQNYGVTIADLPSRRTKIFQSRLDRRRQGADCNCTAPEAEPEQSTAMISAL